MWQHVNVKPYHKSANVFKWLSFLLFSMCVVMSVLLALGGWKNSEISQPQQASRVRRSADNCSQKCLNPACIEAAARIQASIDESVNPCDDFYQFACGKWMQNNVIPDDKAEVAVFNRLSEDLSVVMKNALEEKVSSKDLTPVKNAKLFYQTCMNMDINSVEQGVTTMKLLAEGQGGYPFITPGFDVSSVSIEDLFVSSVLGGLGATHGFGVGIDTDAKNSSLRQISFDQASSLIFPSSHFYKDTNQYKNEIAAYKKYVKSLLKFINEDFNQTISSKDLNSITDSVFKFESAFAVHVVPAASRRKVEDSNNITTIGNMQKMFPQFNWKYVVNKVFNESGTNITVDDDEEVNLASYNYFANAADTIFKVDKSLLKTYILLNEIKGIYMLLPNKYREATYAFQKALFGSAIKKKRFEKCFGIVNAVMGQATGRLYVDKMFPEKAKADVRLMITYLKQSLHHLLENNTWMDKKTKKVAKNKLKNLLDQIGYPDWIRDDAKFTEYYRMEKGLTKNFVANLQILVRMQKKRELQKYRTPKARTEWMLGSAIVNAFNMISTNTIFFPAAILQPPFYHQNYPRYLNYGSVGLVIGHEMTHSFDDQGRQRDEVGNSRSWWQPEAVEKFQEQVKCIINQYGNFTAPNNMKLNGVQTQGENIADNGGEKEAFGAYKKWASEQSEPEKTLPGLKYTPEQLFYINFAYTWCANIRTSFYRTIIFTDPHSPKRFRIIGTVQNSKEFSKTFNCKKNDKMNPDKKCSVW